MEGTTNLATAIRKEEFLTTGQIALHCGVNFRTVIRWIKRGYLNAYRLPGRGDHRVSKEEFLKFLSINKLKLPQGYETQKKSVLIVDDDESMARSVERTLRRLGFETEIALDGFRAGFVLSQKKPNFVTLDLKMKDVNGFEVLGMIKSSDELKHIMVLVISGDTEENLKAALERGANAILAKPFSNENLESKVIDLFGKENAYAAK